MTYEEIVARKTMEVPCDQWPPSVMERMDFCELDPGFFAVTKIWAQDQKNKQAAGVFPQLHQAGKIALFFLYQAMEYAAIHEHRAT